MATGTLRAAAAGVARPATMAILVMITAGHFLNDVMQSVLLSIYPLIKDSLALSFAQIGLVTLVFQLTASVLQPFVGLYTDKHPQPWSLVAGMGSTFLGILLLASAHSYAAILSAAALSGVGSSIFHPEA